MWYNVCMGTRGNIVRNLKERHDPDIIEREQELCFVCGARGRDVHEIMSKSHFATKSLQQCIQPMNMVLLCRQHHNIVQGMAGWMGHLFRELHLRYGYDYAHTEFDWYYTNEFLERPVEPHVKKIQLG